MFETFKPEIVICPLKLLKNCDLDRLEFLIVIFVRVAVLDSKSKKVR